MLTKEHILAGKAIFTVKVGEHGLKTITQDHYTFKVTHKPNTLYSKEIYFIATLTGPDNESSYSYLGVLDPINGWVRLTHKSKYSEETAALKIVRRVLDRIWNNQGHMIQAAGWDVRHCGFCMKCGKTLTVPASIESGYGPECSRRLGIGRAVGSPAQEFEQVV